jgi:ankyrin repeat protein
MASNLFRKNLYNQILSSSTPLPASVIWNQIIKNINKMSGSSLFDIISFIYYHPNKISSSDTSYLISNILALQKINGKDLKSFDLIINSINDERYEITELFLKPEYNFPKSIDDQTHLLLLLLRYLFAITSQENTNNSEGSKTLTWINKNIDQTKFKNYIDKLMDYNVQDANGDNVLMLALIYDFDFIYDKIADTVDINHPIFYITNKNGEIPFLCALRYSRSSYLQKTSKDIRCCPLYLNKQDDDEDNVVMKTIINNDDIDINFNVVNQGLLQSAEQTLTTINKYKYNILHLLIQNEKFDILKYILINQNFKLILVRALTDKDEDGHSPFYYICCLGDVDLMKIIQKNVVNIPFSEFENGLITAMECREIDMIEYLLGSDVLNYYISRDVMWQGIKTEDIQIISLLLKNISPYSPVFTEKDNDGETLTMKLVTNAYQFDTIFLLDIFYLLVIRGKKFLNNENDNTGQTVIFYTIDKNFQEMTKALIRNGASLDIKDFYGNSPLFYAIIKKRYRIVYFIINNFFHNGYDDAEKNKDDMTALMLAVMSQVLISVKILLSNNSQNINIQNKINGYSALMLACKKHSVNIVDELLQYGSNLRLKSRSGKSALMIAANKPPTTTTTTTNEDEEILQLLILKGKDKIDFNERVAKTGYTTLMYAAEKNNVAFVRILLETGRVDITIQNQNGKTAYDLTSSPEIKILLNLYRSIPVSQVQRPTKKIKLTLFDNTESNITEDVEDVEDEAVEDEAEAVEDEAVEDEAVEDKDKNQIVYYSNPKGVVIGNHHFEKISGPVSTVMLIPKSGIFGVNGQITTSKVQSGSLPAMWLFGDVHESSEGMCDDCKVDNDKCCKIQSDFFMKSIDSLYSKADTPVDFYIETPRTPSHRLNHIITSLDNNYGVNAVFTDNDRYEMIHPLQNISHRFSTCYLNELRNTMLYHQRCPTRNIRWHEIDARTSESYESIITMITQIIFEHFQSTFSSLFNSLFKLIDSPAEFVFYLRQVADFIEQPSRFIEKMYNVETNPIIKYTSLVYKQISKMQPPYNNYATWYKHFQSMYVNEYYVDLVNSFSKSNSLFNGESNDKGKNIEIYTKYVYNVVTTKLIPFVEELDKSKNRDYQNQIFDKCIELFNNKQFSFINQQLWFSTCFLDFYFITRVFKQPENGYPSILTLAYFGDYHINKIIIFLTKVLQLYTIDFQIKLSIINNNKTHSRCLTLPNYNFNNSVFNLATVSSLTRPIKPIETLINQYQTAESRRKEKKKEKKEIIKNLY